MGRTIGIAAHCSQDMVPNREWNFGNTNTHCTCRTYTSTPSCPRKTATCAHRVSGLILVRQHFYLLNVEYPCYTWSPGQYGDFRVSNPRVLRVTRASFII